MSDQGNVVRRRIHGDLSDDEIFAWIGQTLVANADRRARGIAMSHAVYLRLDRPDSYEGVKIAEDPDLYPEDMIEVRFD